MGEGATRRLAVRDWTGDDVDRVVSYFLDGDEDFLVGMGVDVAKLPERDRWRAGLLAQLASPLDDRERHYQIWLIDGEPVGHSNLSDIEPGVRANMHLHMWLPERRRAGDGTELVRLSVDRHFELFDLPRIFCEPYAHNPAPNRTLPKLAFELLETVECVPGPISYPQEINRWVMTRDRWRALRSGR